MTSEKQKNVGQFYDFLKYGLETDDPSVSNHLLGTVDLSESDLAGEKVLEVGIGRGNWSMALSRHAATYAGADFSMESVRHVRDKFDERVVRADIAALPFPDDHYDRVFGIGVLPAVERHRAGFAELARVLKPGGTIHLFCYGRVFPRNLIRDVVYLMLSRMPLEKQRKACYKFAMWAKYPIPESLLFRSDMEFVQLDWYMVPIQNRHTYHQIGRWMAQDGIEAIKFTPYPHPSRFMLHRMAARLPMLDRLISPDFFATGIKGR